MRQGRHLDGPDHICWWVVPSARMFQIHEEYYAKYSKLRVLRFSHRPGVEYPSRWVRVGNFLVDVYYLVTLRVMLPRYTPHLNHVLSSSWCLRPPG